ncbi:MAG: HD domain-containing protein [Desulfarculaceae bacterium]|nr:HD domain-containing protein [Desulfarculaceae bacterium]MCF8073681.1 HD domain-containing protein [Desulfarculaceae bacterium]MCF8101922.1 HD domain-containing protein [Desulfarculaceae bacterium]MCF8117655.1 HD domain-containing protein [Desulfarculaceae bacterium]
MTPAGPAINGLQPGTELAGSYLLLRCSLGATKNGKPYGMLRLGDRTGEVAAKLWDRAEELLDGLEAGMVVKLSGKVDSYQGRTQVVLNSLTHDPELKPAEFLPASPVPLETLQAGLAESLAAVSQPDLKQLLESIFVHDREFAAAFERAPAAKGAHHAYVHGLLEHTVACAKAARALAALYPEELEAQVLMAGALLHDIGKVTEMTIGPPIDYTDEGRMEGHLALGLRMLEVKMAGIKDFPPRLAEHLRHMILSHHGAYEFGSPRKPKTAEALALNFVDDMDAKMNMAAKARREAGPGHWSEYHRLLERFLYVGPGPLEGLEPGEAIQEPAPAPPVEEAPRPKRKKRSEPEAPAAPDLFGGAGERS